MISKSPKMSQRRLVVVSIITIVRIVVTSFPHKQKRMCPCNYARRCDWLRLPARCRKWMWIGVQEMQQRTAAPFAIIVCADEQAARLEGAEKPLNLCLV